MSDILTLLQHRRSNKQLGDQAPNAEQLTQMFKAALRVPDHGKLKPYRFVVIEKAAMPKLHSWLAAAVDEFGLDEKVLAKAEKIANQAPLVIGVVAKIDPNLAKVPAWEQMISAGCATYALQLAAYAQGFDSVWISKHWVNGSALRAGFGCEADDKVVSLLLIGSPKEGEGVARSPESESPEGFVQFIRE